MKNLIIIGARGFGRETFTLAKNCKGYGKDYLIKGFLDDKSDALNGFENYPSILGSVENYTIKADDVFICALGHVKWKKFYSEIILNRGGKFINLIHPSVVFHDNVEIGLGLIICQGSCLSNDIKIGNFVTILSNCVLGHDVTVGNWCHIGAFSFMGGFSILEDEATLNVRATVLPRVLIKEGASVGASSLAIRNVKKGTTVFGVPAQVLKF